MKATGENNGNDGNESLVDFLARFTASDQFAGIFKEGMGLVEETANYLDGPGRQDARLLDRTGAIAYATESMRLTTRLMQLASWLLLHRAVNEGEMSLAQAHKEKSRVKVGTDRRDADVEAMLPERLRDLIARSLRIQERIQRMDASMHAAAAAPAANPVEHQLGLIRAAFPGAK